MALLTKDQILSADDLKSELVAVPEWGGDVRVRTMTGTERDAFSNTLTGPDGKVDTTNYRARLLAHCIVDEDGAVLFSDEDVTALGSKSAAALARVFEVAERLNGVGAAAVEEAAKN